jgi:3-phenylpropionate/trans-cinnamate dioxygenase ferredoxin component
MTDSPTQAFRVLGDAATIAEGTVVPFYLHDRRVRVSVARVDGRLYAFDDLCTCANPACPLSGGLLTGEVLMCQCHGSRFDVKTGAVVHGPAERPLTVYEVQEFDSQVQLRG